MPSFCPRCGIQLNSPVKSCPGCGHGLEGKVPEDADESPATAGVNEVDASSPEIPDEKQNETTSIDLSQLQAREDEETEEYTPFCRKCGMRVVRADSLRCARCGVFPLCPRHYDEEQGVCAVCTPESFTETTSITLPPTSAPPAMPVFPASAPETPPRPTAGRQAKPPSFDRADPVSLETARRWADAVCDAVKVIVGYEGLPTRTSLTQSTDDIDLLVKRLLWAGANRRKAYDLAQEIIGNLEDDVAVWRSREPPARTLGRLRSGTLGEGVLQDSGLVRDMYPLLFKVSRFVLEELVEEPRLFGLFMGERVPRPGSAGTFSLKVRGTIPGRRRTVAFEKLDPPLLPEERRRTVDGVLALAEQAAHSIVGLAGRSYGPASRYRRRLAKHPLKAVRDVDRRAS